MNWLLLYSVLSQFAKEKGNQLYDLSSIYQNHVLYDSLLHEIKALATEQTLDDLLLENAQADFLAACRKEYLSRVRLLFFVDEVIAAVLDCRALTFLNVSALCIHHLVLID